MLTHMLPWLPAARLHNGRKICTRKCKWALRLRCASVGGSAQAVFSTSCLCEPTLCIQSCLPLDFEASAELGEADINDDAEPLEVPKKSQMIA